MMQIILSRLFFILGAVALNACDSSNPETLQARFSSINTLVFSQSCASSGCHSETNKAGNLNLAGNNSYENLINRKSSYSSDNILLTPFAPDDSFIIQVLENALTASQSDPHAEQPLPQESIDIIRTWIKQGAVVATLDSIQTQVFSGQCAVCHETSNPPGGLNLEPGLSYQNLVGVKRNDNPEIRVVAGDTKNSFLIDKLEGNNLSDNRGDRMPLNVAALPQEVIDTIKEWINAGANP